MNMPNFSELEPKWQLWWENHGLHTVELDNWEKKLYCLVMFSYPSGDKLHIGHWYNFGPTDTWARYKRMNGYRVFEPMGFDAFGLPAENYAIKHGVHPNTSTERNTATMEKQLKAIGAMYDWSKKIDTSKPEYYKWTQWIFLKLYEKGLAYRSEAPVNWCPSCATVLANEQVVEGCCERCEAQVVRKKLKQWFFKTTEYAQRLLDNIPELDWPDKTKQMQVNWIGRSEGAHIEFPISIKGDALFAKDSAAKNIKVFTTRPDTLMGVTYMVLAPEHPWVSGLTSPDRKDEVEKYIESAAHLSEIDRTSTEREKTGVFLGSYCKHPITGDDIQLWIGDYVIATYGTGAVMAVPAHDQRDYDFAKHYGLKIKQVIKPSENDDSMPVDAAFTDPGIMVNSGDFDGLSSEEGKKKVCQWLSEKALGGSTINFRLRDWLVSRQRYWGAPIPIIYCEKCGEVPVPEDQLPVVLPMDVEIKYDGESPLARHEGFMDATCPKCGEKARREPDTMDTFVCSSWYYLRYPSVGLNDFAFDKEITNNWLPVDMYVGGAEHACMHLLYARFFTMALHDMGLLKFEEPFTRLVHQGCITNNGAKMSKSKGNVVSPDEFVQRYGADTFRMYLMFMGDYTEGGDWSDTGIAGIERFLKRLWKVCETSFPIMQPDTPGNSENDKKIRHILHKTIKAVTRDIDNFKFNTAIARMMELVSEMVKYTAEGQSPNPGVLNEAVENIIKLLAPFAPHISEELNARMGGACSVFELDWPVWDEELAAEDLATYAIQVNGKLRDTLPMKKDASKDEVLGAAKDLEKVIPHLQGCQIIKEIFVPGKIVNFVVRPQ